MQKPQNSFCRILCLLKTSGAGGRTIPNAAFSYPSYRGDVCKAGQALLQTLLVIPPANPACDSCLQIPLTAPCRQAEPLLPNHHLTRCCRCSSFTSATDSSGLAYQLVWPCSLKLIICRRELGRMVWALAGDQTFLPSNHVLLSSPCSRSSSWPQVGFLPHMLCPWADMGSVHHSHHFQPWVSCTSKAKTFQTRTTGAKCSLISS